MSPEKTLFCCCRLMLLCMVKVSLVYSCVAFATAWSLSGPGKTPLFDTCIHYNTIKQENKVLSTLSYYRHLALSCVIVHYNLVLLCKIAYNISGKFRKTSLLTTERMTLLHGNKLRRAERVTRRLLKLERQKTKWLWSNYLATFYITTQTDITLLSLYEVARIRIL